MVLLFRGTWFYKVIFNHSLFGVVKTKLALMPAVGFSSHLWSVAWSHGGSFTVRAPDLALR